MMTKPAMCAADRIIATRTRMGIEQLWPRLIETECDDLSNGRT